MRYWQAGHLFCISAFLSSCIKQLPSTIKNSPEVRSVEPPLSQELPPFHMLGEEERAYLLDVPFPQGSIPRIMRTKDKRNYMLMYESGSSLEDLCAFHRAEMDYHKWHEIGTFLAYESCLVFEKASRHCIITLRPTSGKYSVIVCVGPKKQVIKDLC